MQKFDNILIVSDIDGTFLNREKKLVPRNLRAIEDFQRRGGRFTFATGRVPCNIARKLPEVYDLPNAPGILANGTCLFDFREKRVVEAVYMEPGPIVEAMRMVHREYPDLGIRVAAEDHFITPAFTGVIARDLAAFRDTTEISDPADWTGVGWYKVVVRGEDERLFVLRDRIEAEWPGAFMIVRSEPGFLEFQREGFSKATMLERLRECCTVDGRRPIIYAVGDYENDYEMLLAADVAVCPTNALESIRDICSIQPSDNDEGVIAALIEVIERTV
ncbi:MAG: HAD hydrolase family protein [Clostridia bacterium]|nr:HAD hydrolase family protein [Clostridia bacterium]